MPSTFSTRILHISDIHFRSTEGNLPPERIQQVKREAWKRYKVLGEAWAKNLKEISDSDKPVDLVCMTGDIADWGLPQEYVPATKFVTEVLDCLQLDRTRFFVVPGNHDIHRRTEEVAWRTLRNAAWQVNASYFSGWMAGAPPPLGIDNAWRDAVLKRSSAYRDWVSHSLQRPELLPENSPHKLLGYHSKVNLPDRPFPIHIVGLDSAFLAGDDDDAGKLRVTEDQVGILTTNEGQPLTGLRIALIHHPLTDLADGSDVRRLLAQRVDLLLRGHQHEPISESWEEPDRLLLELAAGCLYEAGAGHQFPNAFQIIDVITNESGQPLNYDLWFRGWSHRGHWFDDASLYPSARNGRLSLPVKSRKTEPAHKQATSADLSKPGKAAKPPLVQSEGRESTLPGRFSQGTKSEHQPLSTGSAETPEQDRNHSPPPPPSPSLSSTHKHTNRTIAHRMIAGGLFITSGIGLLSWLNATEDNHRPKGPTAPASLLAPLAPSLNGHASNAGISGLRSLHRVRPLQSNEDGLFLAKAPVGIFGYINPQGISQTSKSTVHQLSAEGFVEIHKLPTGASMLIGYSQDADARAIQRGRPARLILSTKPLAQAQTAVAVPAEWVAASKISTRGSEIIFDFR